MAAVRATAEPAGPAPDPAGIGTLDDVAGYLRRLRAWAHHLPYTELVRRINRDRDPRDPARQTTVYDCFRRGRKRLDADLVVDIAAALGLDEPGRSRLHRAVVVAQGQPEATAVAEVLPSLPAPSATFTGRAADLGTLVERLPAAAPPVAVIVGPAGVGKTELALAAADRLRRSGRYGEMQLFVDLHGFDADRPPVPPAAVLAGMLQRLGVASERIYRYRSVAARGELLRSALAGRHAILVLDNAASGDQVRDLLPGSPTCVVLVTSRQRFDGTLPHLALSLDALSGAEALSLLRGFDSAGRVDAEPEQARRLADELCFRMPLDLVALGGRLSDPGEASWTLADHVARLEWFPADEVSRPALAASYDRLPAAAQRMFRLLALHPGSDFTAFDAAALAGVGLPEAQGLLGQLRDRHLLLQRQPGRFQLHDAVRAYADRLGRDQDPRSAQLAALDRLLDYHQHAVWVAMGQLRAAGEPGPVPAAGDPVPPMPAVADVPGAVAWLDAERTNLVAVAAHAAGQGHRAHAVALSASLPRYLDSGGHWLDAELLHTHASRTDDPADRAVALVNLGNTEFRLGAYDQAAGRFRQALGTFRRLGDRTGQARARNGMGLVHYRFGRYHEARACWEQALAGFRETGALHYEGSVLGNLGGLEIRFRRYEQARRHHQRGLEVARAVADVGAEARELGNLGVDHLWLGQHDQAHDYLSRALALARGTGMHYTQARAVGVLGILLQHQERYEESVSRLREALEWYRHLRDPEGEAEARNHLAQALRLQGNPDPAMEQHQVALALAEEIGLRHEQARAHEGIGRLLHGLGDLAGAASHWKQAEDILRELGVPDADEVTALLETIPR